jgi:hypothetical protein
MLVQRPARLGHRADRPQRLGQDDHVQRHHRVRTGRLRSRPFRRPRDHRPVRGQGRRPRRGPHLPAEPGLRPADPAREPPGGPPCGPQVQAQGALQRRTLPGAPGLRRPHPLGAGPCGQPLLRPAEAPRTGDGARAGTVGDPAGRARRRDQPDADRADGRPHLRTQRAGRHLPAGRAQHGVRHGDLRRRRGDGAGCGDRLREPGTVRHDPRVLDAYLGGSLDDEPDPVPAGSPAARDQAGESA